MTRFAISIVLLIVACGKDDPANAFAETAHPSATAARRDEPIDIHGLTVRFLVDGSVQLTGTDRWGKPLDTTYENVEYFRKAVPVLERSVTAEQAAGLRTVAR